VHIATRTLVFVAGQDDQGGAMTAEPVPQTHEPSEDRLVTVDQSTSIDDHNEPRPDIVVTNIENLQRSPSPITDALLVAEVISPTSALRDTEMKRALYACRRSGLLDRRAKPGEAGDSARLRPGVEQNRR
jgi:Putative restriction endonuclease